MQLERTVQALCDGGVDFVVIGGVAATLHGSGRVTYDLDICYSRAAANLRRLAAPLAPFHPRPRGFPEALIGAIELPAEVAGLSAFDGVQARSLTVMAFGREILTRGLPALIQAKRGAGREKDVSALAEIESLLQAGQ